MLTTRCFQRLTGELGEEGFLNRVEAKVTTIEADLSRNLPLADETWSSVIAEIQSTYSGSKIIHCAANVKFDDPLQKMLSINTNSVIELMHLADRLGHSLDNFVYVSTAYAGCLRPGRDVFVSERNSREERQLIEELGPTTEESIRQLTAVEVSESVSYTHLTLPTILLV